jgi:hypothetical protein
MCRGRRLGWWVFQWCVMVCEDAVQGISCKVRGVRSRRTRATSMSEFSIFRLLEYPLFYFYVSFCWLCFVSAPCLDITVFGHCIPA